MRSHVLPALLMPLLTATSVAEQFDFTSFSGHRFSDLYDESETDAGLDLQKGKDWGFIVGRAASETARYELLYSHQHAGLTDTQDPDNAFDLNIHYLHLGGTLSMMQDKVTPFITGGMGMTFMNPDKFGLRDETHLSLSVGGGLRWSPTDDLGIRLEVRGYGMLNEGSGDILCGSGCNLRVEGDVLPQYETNLGLIFRF